MKNDLSAVSLARRPFGDAFETDTMWNTRAGMNLPAAEPFCDTPMTLA
jgi:hypothetical protein